MTKFGLAFALLVSAVACVKAPPQEPVRRYESATGTPSDKADSSFIQRLKAASDKVRLFLPNEIEPPKAQRPIPPDDLDFEVNELTWLEQNPPISAEEEEEDPDCDAAYRMPEFDPSDPTIRSIQTSTDFAKCMQKTMQDGDVVKSATFDWSVVIGCDAWREESNSAPIDTTGSGLTCKGQRFALFYQTRIAYEMTSQDANGKMRSVTSYSATDGGPCVATRDGDNWMLDGCEAHQVDLMEGEFLPDSSELDPADLPMDHAISLNFHNVRFKDEDHYYRIGSADLTLGEWQGEVRFGDGTTPPRWQLKNGSFERAGFFQPPSASLRSIVRKRFKDPWRK